MNIRLINSLRPSFTHMRQYTSHYWFRWWLAPSHYLTQCWKIDNWPPGNKVQWNRNPYIFIQENEFENVVWKIVAILSWPQCVYKPVIQLQLNNMICISVFVILWTCVTLSASCNSFYLKKYDRDYLLYRRTEVPQKHPNRCTHAVSGVLC